MTINKKLISYLSAVVVIGLGVGTFFLIKNQPKPQLKDHIEVNLTDEQRATIEKNISDTTGKIEAAPSQKGLPKKDFQALYLQLGSLKYSLGDLAGAREAYEKA